MAKPEEQQFSEEIDLDTLADIAASRAILLEKKGVHRQAARALALLEKEKRRELARLVGPEAALLAKLEWNEMGDLGVSLRLVLDDAPDDLSERFIFEFKELPDPTPSQAC